MRRVNIPTATPVAASESRDVVEAILREISTPPRSTPSTRHVTESSSSNDVHVTRHVSAMRLGLRVGSIPVVATLGKHVTGVVEGARTRHPWVLGFPLRVVEKVGGTVIRFAASTLEKPIEVLSQIALNKLDQLERDVPVMFEPTHKVAEALTPIYTVTLKPAVVLGTAAYNMVSGVEKYAVNGLTSLNNQVSRVLSVNVNAALKTGLGKNALGLLQTTVDSVAPLPPSHFDPINNGRSSLTQLPVDILKALVKSVPMRLKNLVGRTIRLLDSAGLITLPLFVWRQGVFLAKAWYATVINIPEATRSFVWDLTKLSDEEAWPGLFKYIWRIPKRSFIASQRLFVKTILFADAIALATLPNSVSSFIINVQKNMLIYQRELFQAKNLVEMVEITLSRAAHSLNFIRLTLLQAVGLGNINDKASGQNDLVKDLERQHRKDNRFLIPPSVIAKALIHD